MPNPHLLFCPYLPTAQLDGPIRFADWEIGPLRFFEDRWADPNLKSQAMTLLGKFTMPLGRKRPIQNFAILCKKGEQLDGRRPSIEELRALELALAFGFLDSNPKEKDEQAGSAMVTTDNVELHLWSIDLQQDRVALNRGYVVETRVFADGDSQFVIAPPLDLHTPNSPPRPDPLVLTGVYEATLASLRSPDAELEARRIHVAVGWLAKAWRNTATVHCPERLVFLKTAFEAITGKSRSRQSASALRKIFESLPDAAECDPDDFLADFLVWSPNEEPVHTWKNRSGKTQSDRITDLEAWFLAFSDVRNTIIHEGVTPDLTYPGSTSLPITSREIYHDDYFRTATYLLCGAIKVLLSKMGHKDAWCTEPWRRFLEHLKRDNLKTGDPSPGS